VALHCAELFTGWGNPHQWALILIAGGFGILSAAAFLSTRQVADRIALGCLFLFSISFVHFGYQHVGSPWSAEITWHHLGIPLALVVLLQDYRFLLLDAFIRFLMNSALAVAYVVVLLLLNQKLRLWNAISSNTFYLGLALVAFCLSLILFAHVRNNVQRWIGRVLFRRQSLEPKIASINRLGASATTEDYLLFQAAAEVGAHLRTGQVQVVSAGASASNQPAILLGKYGASEFPWAEAQIPLRFSSGEPQLILVGARRGRQRYLSEDLDDMRLLGAAIVEQVERFRSQELQRLAARAELRALQAQINPHFFFNALNTLYGTIDRRSEEARKLVLNLAEVFRYFLGGERICIPLAEELRIIHAYLEIEKLRLGDRLETSIEVSDSALSVFIPVLSVQPLIENAVKHGVALKPGNGRVELRANVVDGELRIAVSDTGMGFDDAKLAAYDEGAGMGLDNVRRRLQLSYGVSALLKIESSESGSTVSFSIPVSNKLGSFEPAVLQSMR
jgi:signal transduction histidine kinase